MAASRLLLRFLATGSLLALAGCGTKQPTAPRPRPPVVAAPPATAVSAADYMKVESSRALLVVRASELALVKSASSRVQALATRLRSDHRGIAAQLNMAGRRINLLPSATPLMLDQAQLDGLARASDFDAAFLRTMRGALETCERANSAYADQGASPTLRPVARFAAATCRDELKAL